MIQQLIDELRKALPGYHVELELYPSGGCISASGCAECGTDESKYEAQNWRKKNCAAKTPDEALTLLRQRLGLEGMDCPDCPNQGWYVTRTGHCQTDVEQTQCGFCYGNPQSKFSIANNLGLEGEK